MTAECAFYAAQEMNQPEQKKTLGIETNLWDPSLSLRETEFRFRTTCSML